ncbi:MAG: hypothetical protein SFU20_09440 [Chitinophagaceae bacterium]|nr:hypothetical protein [Chitinophagaceae bacterium]
MNLIQKLLLFTVMFSCTSLYSQDSLLQQDLISLPTKYFNKLQEKYESLGESLDKRAAKMLNKARKSEERLFKQLWKKDSAKAKELFGDVRTRYAQLQSQAKERAAKLTVFSKLYSGRIDSLTTSLKFLEGTDLVPASIREKLPKGMEGLSALQGKLDQAEIIRKALQDRRKELAAALANSGLGKYLKDFNKQVYYYQQQVNEYKEILKDPAKLEERIFGLLSKIPAFKDFFVNNSQLGQLFSLPGATAPPGSQSGGSLGLQTRASVMQDLQTRFGSGPQVQQAMQQNLQSAQSQLNQLKDKVNQYLPQGGSSDSELPDFKPNNQRTKGFWKRLELGTNFQNQKRNSLLPVTSDLGFSLGYRLNERSIIGIGASYKLGWGESIQKIRLSHQGAGLRSFIDWKIKGSFYLSGGYELNYQPALRNVTLTNPSGTGVEARVRSESGLLGISKIVSLNSKLFRKTRVQVLWDFLSGKQMPRAQPLIFRIGYTF